MVVAGGEPAMTQVIVSGLAEGSASSWLDRCAALRLGRGNLFDLIRLYAATQVLLAHGTAHLGFKLPALLAIIFSLPGVPLFFSISGFLVGLSCLKSRGRWGDYVWHRALRIFPALWLCLLLSVLILIAFGRGSFLFSTAGFAWLVAQATVLQFFNPSQLRDFGVGVINGSLWTIPVELQFYLLFPLIVGWLAFLADKRKVGLSIVSMAAIWGSSFFVGKVLLNGSLLNPESLLAKLLHVSLVPHLFQFLLGFGCLLPLALWGRPATARALVALGLVVGLLALAVPSAQSVLAPIAMAALPIGIGLIPVDLLRGFDLSYGIYVFHMPIANALLVSGVSKALSVPAYLFGVYALACLSWLYVEKPALALKSRVPVFLRSRACG